MSKKEEKKKFQWLPLKVPSKLHMTLSKPVAPKLVLLVGVNQSLRTDVLINLEFGTMTTKFHYADGFESSKGQPSLPPELIESGIASSFHYVWSTPAHKAPCENDPDVSKHKVFSEIPQHYAGSKEIVKLLIFRGKGLSSRFWPAVLIGEPCLKKRMKRSFSGCLLLNFMRHYRSWFC